MNLEGVIVCKDYSDFLEHTLPHNLQFFDHLVIVTHPNDHKTKALCSKYSVTYVETTCMHDEGDKFNKGRAINLGLGHLRGQDWILHLDADIVLPYNFRTLLRRARLEKTNLYGADRMNVYGYDAWMRFGHGTKPSHKDNYFVQPPSEFTMGARIIHQEHGYTPIGYFQLWHKSMGKRYPITQGNAEHTDVLFACQWTRAQRVLLPEIVCFHLESNEGPIPMGANWNGRTTPIFGPKKHHHKPHHGYRPHVPPALDPNPPKSPSWMPFPEGDENWASGPIFPAKEKK